MTRMYPDVDARALTGESPPATPSVNETASPTTLIKGEETGSLIDTTSAERLMSALALVQRELSELPRTQGPRAE